MIKPQSYGWGKATLMIQTLPVTKAMTSLSQAHQILKLSPANDARFFTDWFENLPELTEAEKRRLDRYRDRYFYYAEDGAISEGTVNLIIISPLLEVLGLYDPPFSLLIYTKNR
ncbi:hypothetical protein ACFVKH_01295 [Almyronema epifaneia S1]|uniref:Uncharacterized protein n=2 Tax=Almyronema TaxID=3114804 RepID=A0ABW6IAJ0_9CYAN